MSLQTDPTEQRGSTDRHQIDAEPAISIPTQGTGATSGGAATAAEDLCVGDRLSRARAAQGLAIEEVSSRSYIRSGILRRMESDDFAGCGGACYARGQLRILAGVLRLDEAELIAAFDRHDARSESPLALDDEPATESSRTTRTSVSPGAWLALTILALLAGLLVATVLR